MYGDLRHLALNVQSTLEVSLETNALEKPLNLISVDSENIEVKLAGIITSVTLRTDDYSAVPSALAHDTLLVVGLAFERLGQAARGAALLEIAWPHSQLARTRAIYTRLAVTLFKAGKGKQLIDCARLLLNTQSDEDLAIAFDLLTLTYVDFSTSQVVNDARAVEMARFAAIMVAKNHRPQAAAMYYNIASSFRARHDFRNALRNYRRAGSYDPQYCSRAYYCKELAGVLFLLRRYSMSVRFYELAFKIDADRTTLPLLADAHMFRGEYALAQSTLKKYFEGEPRVEDSDWHLKLLALDEIQERARTGSQRRRRAMHSLDPATATESELQAHYEDSIATDGLDGFAWVNLGRLLYRLGKLEEALGCLLVAVAIVPHDAESWAGVIAISRKLDLTALFGLALAAAHQSLGTAIFEHLPDMGVVGDELIARLERLHAPDLTTTVRFPRPDGAIGTATLVHRRGGRES